MHFENIALQVPEILLPREGTDLTKWAVVACDQYTSQPKQWETIAQTAADSPSTLNIIFPEVYLEDGDADTRIASINQAMQRYLREQILVPQNPGFILVDRKTAHVPSRKGLIVALDLEHYDFSTGSKTLIRATEGTVMERIPPRVKIRQNAPIESPHIMVLIDDPDKTVIEPLFQRQLKKLYDFDLMLDSGHITGYLVDEPDAIASIADSLARLADPENFKKRYDVADGRVLLYAMGDGNHSLATAKVIWETLKREAADKDAIMRHPARYSLVELVNIHDAGLEFEPIHRVLFNLDYKDLFARMRTYFEKQGSTCATQTFASLAELKAQPQTQPQAHLFPYVTPGGYGIFTVDTPKLFLEYATLQTFLDAYLKETPSVKIDYVHGEEIVTELGSQAGNIGFYLPTISKQTFFKTIVLDGALPRKTFSMGHADEKRFYLECRRITS